MSIETRAKVANPAEPESTPESQTLELSVVVPAYREGRRIHDNLAHLVRELDTLGIGYEVIVVSDGNTDATVSEARRVASPGVKVFHYPMNVGKGFALSLGVAQCSSPLVTFIDADMEVRSSKHQGIHGPNARHAVRRGHRIEAAPDVKGLVSRVQPSPKRCLSAA